MGVTLNSAYRAELKNPNRKPDTYIQIGKMGTQDSVSQTIVNSDDPRDTRPDGNGFMWTVNTASDDVSKINIITQKSKLQT